MAAASVEFSFWFYFDFFLHLHGDRKVAASVHAKGNLFHFDKRVFAFGRYTGDSILNGLNLLSERFCTWNKEILGVFAYPLEMVYFKIYRSFETILRQIFYPGYAK